MNRFRNHACCRLARAVYLALALVSSCPSGQAGSLDPRLIVEFENTQLGHYFLADPLEAQFVDQGGAGPGWRRTGESFWEQSVVANLGVPVCRFYGSVFPGPNSHFFTADTGAASECEALKALAASLPPDVPKWNYEGYSFRVVPFIDGTCPSEFLSLPPTAIPVYRLYNRGFERGIDSNHRYSSKREIVEAMKQQGWAEEGVAWCIAPR